MCDMCTSLIIHTVSCTHIHTVLCINPPEKSTVARNTRTGVSLLKIRPFMVDLLSKPVSVNPSWPQCYGLSRLWCLLYPKFVIKTSLEINHLIHNLAPFPVLPALISPVWPFFFKNHPSIAPVVQNTNARAQCQRQGPTKRPAAGFSGHLVTRKKYSRFSVLIYFPENYLFRSEK